ncbi:MAG: L,D-transpeptidase family protein [Deltaproteobacteria bacterium]|nr:L,D-transpeptidase family protein [Deltaproteobacteria bacterium]
MLIKCPSCGLEGEYRKGYAGVIQCRKCQTVFCLSETVLPDKGLSERIWRVKGEGGLPVSLRVLRFRVNAGNLSGNGEISPDGKRWIKVASHPMLARYLDKDKPHEETNKEVQNKVSPPQAIESASQSDKDEETELLKGRRPWKSALGFASFALIASGAFFFPLSKSLDKLDEENRQLNNENQFLKGKLSGAEDRIAGLEKQIDSIGRKFEEVKQSNEEFLRAKEVLEDIKKSIDSHKVYLAVSLGENLLYVKIGSKTLKEYTVSTGKGWTKVKKTGKTYNFLTPRGKRVIEVKQRNPIWYKPDWVWHEKGLELPKTISIEDRAVKGELGKYRLKLGGGYAIHGTKSGVINGKKETHGCIRMGKKDLKELYSMVKRGTEVYIY